MVSPKHKHRYRFPSSPTVLAFPIAFFSSPPVLLFTWFSRDGPTGSSDAPILLWRVRALRFPPPVGKLPPSPPPPEPLSESRRQIGSAGCPPSAAGPPVRHAPYAAKCCPPWPAQSHSRRQWSSGPPRRAGIKTPTLWAARPSGQSAPPGSESSGLKSYGSSSKDSAGTPPARPPIISILIILILVNQLKFFIIYEQI